MTEAAERSGSPGRKEAHGTVLLVEDDRVDAMAVQRAFRELAIEDRLEVVVDGQAALDHLDAQAGDPPSLILLDLNMPRMNGVEFLFARRSRPHLMGIPVVVMTTSTEEKDRIHSFDLGVSGYIVKPVDYREFVEQIRSLQAYRRTGKWHGRWHE